ncbi:MAG: HNH endonuclease signature motif containing protein [bacterium]|nr:HNH endonuclease signature motif containing protein [bacterium]
MAVFRDMACQGKIVPSVFDTRGQPLWVGMSKRLATRAQRLALIARDRGCVGCGADPAWCQAHHIVPWEADGPTDIDNLVLLCSRCHHQVHDDGWRVQQSPDGKRRLRPPAKGHRPPPSNKIRRRRTAKPKTKLLL